MCPMTPPMLQMKKWKLREMEKSAQVHTIRNGSTSPFYFMYARPEAEEEGEKEMKGDNHTFKGLFPSLSAPLPHVTAQVTKEHRWE